LADIFGRCSKPETYLFASSELKKIRIDVRRYDWGSVDEYGPVATDLVIGSYVVQIKDANGCVDVQTVELPSPVGGGTSLVSPNTAVTSALAVVIALFIVGGLLALASLIAKPAYYQDKTPFFCILINVGVLIGYIAAATTLPQPTDSLCAAFPWLVGIAFTLIYGCLFLKTWRVFWILRAAQKLHKVKLSTWYICKLIGLYFLFELTYLVIWTVADPLKAEYVSVIDNQEQLQCNSKNWGTFWGVFLGYKFLWMLFGALMAVRTRTIFEKFNESKQIYYCIYNAVTVLVIGIPLAAVLMTIPHALVILEVVILLLICTFTLVCLFFSVWMQILFKDHDDLIDGIRKRNFGPPPPVGMSPLPLTPRESSSTQLDPSPRSFESATLSDSSGCASSSWYVFGGLTVVVVVVVVVVDFVIFVVLCRFRHCHCRYRYCFRCRSSSRQTDRQTALIKTLAPSQKTTFFGF